MANGVRRIIVTKEGVIAEGSWSKKPLDGLRSRGNAKPRDGD